MERVNVWKSVFISVFWIIIALCVSCYGYDQAMFLMSKASTLSVLAGLFIVLLSVVILVSVVDFQYYKIKRVRKMSSQHKEENSEEADNGK